MVTVRMEELDNSRDKIKTHVTWVHLAWIQHTWIVQMCGINIPWVLLHVADVLGILLPHPLPSLLHPNLRSPADNCHTKRRAASIWVRGYSLGTGKVKARKQASQCPQQWPSVKEGRKLVDKHPNFLILSWDDSKAYSVKSLRKASLKQSPTCLQW